MFHFDGNYMNSGQAYTCSGACNPTPDPTPPPTGYECARANCADLLWTGPLWGYSATTGVYLGTLRISSIFLVITSYSSIQ